MCFVLALLINNDVILNIVHTYIQILFLQFSLGLI